jgi:H(+)-transporting two-sector ATPase
MRVFLLRKKSLTTTQIIAAGFLCAIILGTILLMLPVSSKAGVWTNPVDAMFTATTSVCVTGLVTVSTADHWSIFGQCVILVLVQFGGLGIVTFTTMMLLVVAKRITLKERLLIRDAYNLDSLNGLVKLTIKVVKGTLLVEGIGALLYMPVFIRDKGAFGIFASIFNAVSAFCNAGMDLIGNDSLALYRDNVLVNFTTISLIILGGIGFPVWWDVIRCIKKRKKTGAKSMWQLFNLHTKLVLFVSFILVFGGAIIIFLLEFNNGNSIGNLSLFNKIQASLFQSVTTRTAGFYTIAQNQFTDATAFISSLLMFVGGSPSGTAGGVKTVTVAMVLLTAIAIVRNRRNTEIFGRSISEENVRKGMAVIIVSLSVMLCSVAALCITQNFDFLDILYECVSAIATVGLTRGITDKLNVIGKIIIIITMYIGRIGPISLALFFNTSNSSKNFRKYPKEDIRVG